MIKFDLDFERSMKDIDESLEVLDQNIKEKQDLDMDARAKILDACYSLETVIYRAVLCNSKGYFPNYRNSLQKLNTTLNRMAMESNHEFLKLANLRIVSLLAFTIDYL